MKAWLTFLYSEGNSGSFTANEPFVILRKYNSNSCTDVVLEYGISAAPERTSLDSVRPTLKEHRIESVCGARGKTDAELIRLAIGVYDELYARCNQEPAK